MASSSEESFEPHEEDMFRESVKTMMLRPSSGRIEARQYGTSSGFVISCDNCHVDLNLRYINYYQCTECRDYYLCEKCEELNDRLIRQGEVPLHNPDHICIKHRG